MRNLLATVAAILIVGFLVHFFWESVQSFAYDCSRFTLNRVIGFHILASLGDAGLMLILYGAGGLLHRNPRWIQAPARIDFVLIPFVGAGLAIGIEWHALSTGRWSYTEWMPVIPGIGVGVLPVLQLVLLPFPIFWAAARLVQTPHHPEHPGT